jgi:CubicO group peptidase (beta-lactamase class C family)
VARTLPMTERERNPTMSSTDQHVATRGDQPPAEHVVTGLTRSTQADVPAGSNEPRHGPQVAAMGTEAVESSVVGGFVEAGFEGVRDAFAAAASRPGGAAFAAYLDGRPVVDLWLGEAAPGRPWEQDTPAVMMSAVKGVTALAGHICVDRGLLDLDAPVATYWPEFAAAGKEDVLVRHVFAHTAGVITVPGYSDFMRPDGTSWEQVDEIVRRIAAATPLWEPGTKAAYHAFTCGWMLGELIRRFTAKSVQDVIRDEIAKPLGIDIRLGAPAGDSLGARRARVVTPPRATGDQPERLAFERAFTSADTPLGQSLMATGTSNPIVELDRFMNDGPGITVPLSGTNGIGTARDLARMYLLLARGGELDGVRLLSEARCETPPPWSSTESTSSAAVRRGGRWDSSCRGTWERVTDRTTPGSGSLVREASTPGPTRVVGCRSPTCGPTSTRRTTWLRWTRSTRRFASRCDRCPREGAWRKSITR